MIGRLILSLPTNTTAEEVPIAQRLMQGFDGHCTKDSIAATVANAVRFYLIDEVLGASVDPAVLKFVKGHGLVALKKNNEFYRYDMPNLLKILNKDDQQSPWLKACGGKMRAIEAATVKAIDHLKSTYGDIEV